MQSYKEVLDYLYACLPMFHRIGGAAYRADLSNTIAFMDVLQHPYRRFRSIHIAGTNGKGSVSHMLASILQEAGYKTGLYTSPHLLDFRERIKINGIPIPEEKVIAFVNLYKQAVAGISPSFFEWTVGLAFDYFAAEKVDVAVIEVGMGGRLDSTNVITPVLSVITNVSYDHMQYLGNTLEKIAIEKAGIIKNSIPVLISEKDPATENVFRAKAKEKSASLYYAEEMISEEEIARWADFLPGSYQKKNVRCVLAATSLLRKEFPAINRIAVEKGISGVRKNTGLRGRWEILQQKPLVVCDVAHNEAGIVQVMQTLSRYSFSTLHIVYGAVKDKDVATIVRLLPPHAIYYLAKPDIPRGMEIVELRQYFHHYSHKIYNSVTEAYNQALQDASDMDMILVTGSFFVVAEVLQFYEGTERSG